MKITDVLDSPPFFLEKHLSYFRDRYCQYFEPDDDRERESPGLVRQESSSKRHRPRFSSAALFGAHNTSHPVAPTLLQLQRANSLNLNTANQ